MKTKNLLALALLLSFVKTLFSGEGHKVKNPEWVPPYHVTSSKKDNNLKNSESVFVFKFYDSHTGKLVTSDIKMSYNEQNVLAKRDPQGKFLLKVKPGKYLFRFFYDTTHFELKTDSISNLPGFITEIEVRFQSSKYPVVCSKPVIYLYPEKTMEVNLKLDLKGKLTFTYPEYKSGWNCKADSTGTIYINDKKYNYLFWEGETEIHGKQINFEEGFIVEKEKLVSFLEEKLTAMGLTSKEQEDFITYWAPLMSANEKNYVHFLFNEEFSEYAPLIITPQPDHVFRVFMIWSKAPTQLSFVPEGQKIPKFERKGFSVLEWGGTQKDNIFFSFENHLKKYISQ